MKKLVRTLIALATTILLAFWALFLSPRPPLTTDPATLAGDGSLVNYCESCTEPLVEGADDIRGLWQEVGGGHVERIEQCGSRVVVTAADLIHDSGPNSTLGDTTNDTEGVVFRVAGKPFCPRTSSSMIWKDGVLNFHVFGFGPVVVKR